MSDKKDLTTPSNDWKAVAKNTTRLPTTGRPALNSEVFLLLDCSGSMEGALSQARSGATAFAKKALQDGWAVGLIRFDSGSHLACLPTRNLEAFDQALPWSANGGTAMHQAIDTAVEYFQSSPRRKAICIVSDGVPDDRQSTIQSAQRAKRAGIEVLVIGIEGSDMAFLDQLVTRKELSKATSVAGLTNAMQGAARLLAPVRALPRG